MDVELREMGTSSLAAFIARSRAAFIEQSLAGGRDRAEVERAAGEVLDRAFPGGRAVREHVVFDIVVAGDARGYLWLGPESPEASEAWWVWDIEIDASQRGRGIGRRAMELAEQAARSRGATSIGLHVFTANRTARRLYESIGYRADAETSDGVRMRRSL